ncbi:Arm DNA-binding domain-containing protein [Thomasclavelia sp.]
MSIRKRASKKAVSGYTYQVYFPYVDVYGMKKKYIKSGFKTKKEAQYHEAQKKNEIVNHGEIFDDVSKTFNEVFIEYMKVEGKMYARATEQYYWFAFKKYVADNIGNRKVFGLKYRDLQAYFNQLDARIKTVPVK